MTFDAALDAALARLASHTDYAEPDALVDLVAVIRPSHPSNVKAAARHLDALAARLEANEGWRAALRTHLRVRFERRHLVSSYTEPGILSTDGLWVNVWRRFVRKLLPDVRDENSLYELAAAVFWHSHDAEWVEGVPERVWLRVIAALDFPGSRGDDRGVRVAYDRLLDAVEVLASRIAAVGVEPELQHNYPDTVLFARPFLGQAAEAHAFVSAYRRALVDGTETPEDEKQLLVLLGQCRRVVARVKKDARRQGASLALTWHLVRLMQQVTRLEAILAVLSPARATGDYRAPWALCRAVIRAASRRNVVSDLFGETTDLLATRIVANAAHTGEHYITSTRAEFWSMAKAAMGAGAIVPFMALVKAVMYGWHLPPVPQAFVFGANYALGFVVLHLMHFALATKQPAMTASTLAASLGESDDETNLDGLVTTTVRVIRSQLVAIVGNVAVAIPTALLLAVALWQISPRTAAVAETASHMLGEIDPSASLALFHAAIAGVCLFLAGIVSGFSDNACAYNAVARRLGQVGWLRRLIGPVRTRALTAYVDEHAGALAGNVVLGFLLAVPGLVGWATGLPLDIRHVTFSAANFGLALATLEAAPSWKLLGWVVTGLLGIGVINLLVSFGLAIGVAMRSHGVPVARARRLLPLLLARLRSHPSTFVFPTAEEDSSSMPPPGPDEISPA